MAGKASFGPWPGVGGGAFPGFGPAPPNTGATSYPGTSGLAARADHTHGAVIADWGAPGSTRFFACDLNAGNDANAGWSDVSQSEAGLVAVKTLTKFLSIIPRIGNGRMFRAAIRSGNYASDTTISFSGFNGYTRGLFIATDTIPSAGAVAFTGDANDSVAMGMTTAAGLHATGYNATAYSVAADGTPTITLQLAGGGAPGFTVTSPGVSPQPYGARLRGDINNPTVALRNKCVSVILVPTNNSLILGLPLGTTPVLGSAGDVFYLEMAAVTGPTTTEAHGTGSAQSGIQLCGLNLGLLFGSDGCLRFGGSEVSGIAGTNLSIIASQASSNVPTGSQTQGLGLRSGGIETTGGSISMVDCADSGSTIATLIQEPELFLWERSAAGGMVLYGGAHALGNNVVEEVGTNSSTVHGAACQIWAPQTTNTLAGTRACGLALYGGYSLGRIRFSNMGAHPGICIGGSGFGIRLQGLSGGGADGNTDVGVDLSPAGVSGNTIGAQGCVISLVNPLTLTGSVGDVRLPDGTIAPWTALLATGLTDTEGNRFISAGGPSGTIPFWGFISANGATPSSSYVEPGGVGVESGNVASPNLYPSGYRMFTGIRAVVNPGNNLTAPCTVTLIKTSPSTGVQVATTLQATIPAGSAPGTQFSDVGHPQLFNVGDAYDVRLDTAAGTASTSAGVSISLEYAV